MFRPNQDCVILRSSGKTDVFGMPLPGQRVKERCSVIQLNIRNEKSSVRADTSASRGNARELQVDAKFLLTKTTKAEIDDVIEFGSESFRVAQKFPRHDTQGRLDHYEIVCTFWNNE